MRADLGSPAPLQGNVMQKIVGSLAGSVFAFGLALVVASSTAAAQPAPKKGADNAAAATPKTKVYDFSGDTIEGDLIKPDGSAIDARGYAKHSSLIRIRKDFINEIVKSAEDL
jgi:hypothetical protein